MTSALDERQNCAAPYALVYQGVASDRMQEYDAFPEFNVYQCIAPLNYSRYRERKCSF